MFNKTNKQKTYVIGYWTYETSITLSKVWNPYFVGKRRWTVEENTLFLTQKGKGFSHLNRPKSCNLYFCVMSKESMFNALIVPLS